MSMWTAKEKSLNYDQAKAEAARAQKDIKMVKQFIQTTVFQFTEYVITTLVKWTDRFLNIFMIKSSIGRTGYSGFLRRILIRVRRNTLTPMTS